MISPKLAGQALELRLHVEGLSGADVEALRDSDQGRPTAVNPRVRSGWSPGPAWSARVELWRLARAIDEVLRDCGGGKLGSRSGLPCYSLGRQVQVADFFGGFGDVI